MPFTSEYTRLHDDPEPAGSQTKAILFLDIDNTLYSSKCGISDQMKDLIQAYFEKLGLSKEEANRLHATYYREYGLSIRGLIKHYNIDPLDYDRNCDLKLPLERLLEPSQPVQNLLRSLDRRKVRLIALTNAYKTHALRVLRILELDDLFEGIISCDYTHPKFSCKPEAQYFAEALQHVNAQHCKPYFVDDSELNVRGALDFGWSNSLHFVEDPQGTTPKLAHISQLTEMRTIWPELFHAVP